jgi:chromosome segregation ATPase
MSSKLDSTLKELEQTRDTVRHVNSSLKILNTANELLKSDLSKKITAEGNSKESGLQEITKLKTQLAQVGQQKTMVEEKIADLERQLKREKEHSKQQAITIAELRESLLAKNAELQAKTIEHEKTNQELAEKVKAKTDELNHLAEELQTLSNGQSLIHLKIKKFSLKKLSKIFPKRFISFLQ